MALLSATQGTPERVLSLLNVISAHGGSMERQALVDWLNPRFIIAGYETKEEKTAVDQTIQAAHGLGLIDLSQRQAVRLQVEESPRDLREFADLIHARLVAMGEGDADAILLEAYAWQAVQVEIEASTRWIDDWTADQFADTADAVLTPAGWTGDRRFNSTKRAPWRRWMELLGLNSSLPTGEAFPYVTPRVERELTRGDLPKGVEISADEAMAYLGKQLPYLDGGKLFERYCTRLGFRMPARTVTRLLSTALRDLQEDGLISLVVRGDSSLNYSLAADPFSRSRSFGAVKFNKVAQHV